MKRPLNFYDGLVLLLIYFKVAGPEAFPFWWIFLPWAVEMFAEVGKFIFRAKGWEGAILEWLTRAAIRIRARMISRGIRRGK